MTISVVIPVYNGEKYISQCLDALENQSRLPDEVIVVDDGSTDCSAALAEAKSAHVIRQKKQGPAAARNAGIQQATGDLVLFTDSDCVPETGWVMELENSLANPEVSGVKGAYATRQTGIVPRLVQFEFEERYDLMQKFPVIDFIDTYSAGFRRQVLQELGGFNALLIKNEDVDLSYHLASAGKVLLFNRKALVYHHHPETWRAYFSSKAKKAYWRIMVYRMHPDKAIKDTYTPQLLKAQIILALAAMLMLIPAWQWQICVWIAVSLWGTLVLTTIPFMRRVKQSEPRLAIYAVLFIFLRSYAFVCGVIIGIFGLLFFNPRFRQPAD